MYNKSTSLFNYPECLQDSRYTKLGSNLFLSKDHSSRIRRTDSESKRKRHSPCRKKTQAANNGLTLQTSGILQIEVLNIYCQVIQFVTFWSPIWRSLNIHLTIYSKGSRFHSQKRWTYRALGPKNTPQSEAPATSPEKNTAPQYHPQYICHVRSQGFLSSTFRFFPAKHLHGLSVENVGCHQNLHLDFRAFPPWFIWRRKSI